MSAAGTLLDDASKRLSRSRLLPGTKGLPAGAYGCALGDVGSLGLNLLAGDLPMPAAVILESALNHNLAEMARFTQAHGVRLCPHGKTTMAPQLFHRQLANGAWGITVATPAQAAVCAEHGIRRIILANQLVDPGSRTILAELVERYPDLDILILVDSLEGLRKLDETRVSRPWQVLLELGIEGGRAGVRTLEAAMVLGRAMRDSACVELRGIESFEGILPVHADHSEETVIEDLLERMGTLLLAGAAEGWFRNAPILLSCGGSAYFDLAAERLVAFARLHDADVLLRSGCYITHDVAYYARHASRRVERGVVPAHDLPDLQSALEVWTVVQSVPEPDRVICAAGKRDMSHDMDLPIPLKWLRPGHHDTPVIPPSGLSVTGMNDQHAYVVGTGKPLPFQVGDMVCFGLSHPCTTFDKWQLIYIVDDAYRVVDAIRTFF